MTVRCSHLFPFFYKRSILGSLWRLHFPPTCLRQCLKWKLLSCVGLLGPYGLQPTRCLCPWDFSGKNSGAGGGALVSKSHPTLSTAWTIAQQSPVSLGFPRREHWSGLPLPSPGDLPTQGINPSLQHCRQILYPLSYQWTLHGKMALQINWIQRGKWLVISELCQKTGLWNIGQELLCGWKWLR